MKDSHVFLYSCNRNFLTLILTTLCLGLFFSSPLQALEVGGIQLHSKLGQPLRATIQLKHDSVITEQEIIINKAPKAIYQQMGINESTQFLNLKFDLQSNGELLVTTHAPIKEPYLNFILQFRWPQGEVNREFNVLIDPD